MCVYTSVFTCTVWAKIVAKVRINKKKNWIFSEKSAFPVDRFRKLSDMYVRDVQEGVCGKDGLPTVLKERAGSAWVDGNNLLGPVVGNFCMDLAIKKAKEAGVGWVVAKGERETGRFSVLSGKLIPWNLVPMLYLWCCD